MRPYALSGVGQPTGGNQMWAWVFIMGVAGFIFWATLSQPGKGRSET